MTNHVQRVRSVHRPKSAELASEAERGSVGSIRAHERPWSVLRFLGRMRPPEFRQFNTLGTHHGRRAYGILCRAA